MDEIVSLTVTLAPKTDAAHLAEVLEARFNVTLSPAELNVLFVEGYESRIREVFGLQADEAGNLTVPVIPPALADFKVVSITVKERREGFMGMEE